MSSGNTGHPNVLDKEGTQAFRKQVEYLREVEGMSWGQIVNEAGFPQVGRAGNTEDRLQDAYRRKPDVDTANRILVLYRDRKEEAALRARKASNGAKEEVDDRTPAQRHAEELTRIVKTLRNVYGLTAEEVADGLGYDGASAIYSAENRGGWKRIGKDRLEEARAFLRTVQLTDPAEALPGAAEAVKADFGAAETRFVEIGTTRDSWDRIRSDLMGIADRIRALGAAHVEGTDLPASVREEIQGVFTGRHDRLIQFIEQELD